MGLKEWISWKTGFFFLILLIINNTYFFIIDRLDWAEALQITLIYAIIVFYFRRSYWQEFE